jgi:hypothetical protein
MAQTEEVILLEVKTLDAVKNVNDLKENISALKKNLGQLDIGTQEYTETLNALKTNQNLLKDAMYATSASLEDVKASATGASESYNSLVHRMAALKEEWRATNDEARRNDVGRQIAEINQQLKDMDASVGNFQRNVGNYESGVTGLVAKFDEWGGILKQMPPTLGAAKEQIGKVGETMQLVGKQPILGIIGLLAPIIVKITESLKENETAMDAVKRLMASLKPVFDVVQNVLEGIATGFAKVVDWMLEFIGQSDGIKKVMSTLSGVGNAILQYLLAPIKSAVAAFKGLGKIIGDVFKGNWSDIKTHARETGAEIAEAYKEGFSFKSNFEEGKVSGSKFISGVKAKENVEAAKEAGKEIGEKMKEGIEEELKLLDVDKALKEGEAKRKAKMDAEKAELESMNEWWAKEMSEVDAEVDTMFEESVDSLMQSTKQKRKMTADEILGITMAVADATSGILSSLADMYESDEKSAERNAKKIKNLRIASATIDMLNGAVGAYAQANSTLPPPVGAIVGAANAAAVIAMGIANINKIKATNPTGNGTPSTPAVVTPPSVETNMQSVRSITSASEEDRLNRMASKQRVYLVASDVEAALDDNKVRVEESSF